MGVHVDITESGGRDSELGNEVASPAMSGASIPLPLGSSFFSSS